MSAFDFIGKMGISKLGQLGDAITSAIVKFDPETASQVEIDNMAAHCRDLATRIATAEQTEDRDHKFMDVLSKQLGDTKRAAEVIGTKLEATTDMVQKAVIDAQLTKLLDQITTIGGEEGDGSKDGTLFDAIQNHAQSETDLHEWQTVHAGAVAQLTTARSRLEQAARDMAHAHEQESRAAERNSQAERDAGLKKGLGTGNIALNAMQQAAEDAKKRARAMTINTDSIKATTGNSADDIVAAALAEATPQLSALDRLRKLNAKAA